MLKCRQCGWDKPNILFPVKKLAGGVVGYRSICKDCTNVNQSARRLAQAGEARVKRAEKQRAWVVANREVIRGLKAKYRMQAKVVKLSSVKHEAHVIAYYKHKTELHDEHVKAWMADEGSRLKRVAENVCYRRLYQGVRRLFGNIPLVSVHGKEWFDVLGYSKTDLRLHIDKQLADGMTWHNMAEWHIDHIKPLRIYSHVRSIHDQEFAECFGLDNLQPLWAVDNFRKYQSNDKLLIRKEKGSRKEI